MMTNYYSLILLATLGFSLIGCRPTIQPRRGIPAPYLEPETTSSAVILPQTPSSSQPMPRQEINLPKAGTIKHVNVPSYSDIPSLPGENKATHKLSAVKSIHRHLVISGDTLSLIAQHYNCEIQDICLLNKGLTAENLKVGQIIIVPRK